MAAFHVLGLMLIVFSQAVHLKWAFSTQENHKIHLNNTTLCRYAVWCTATPFISALPWGVIQKKWQWTRPIDITCTRVFYTCTMQKCV
uniref:Secreted protein n=1 Tax=Pyxicephalus adspersus TaxID=30357 RepID=A0AAV3A2L2_PYXAD|nr:TPA: hypothetical protein GDO54_003733 [Pyxicephalus adspersus]